MAEDVTSINRAVDLPNSSNKYNYRYEDPAKIQIVDHNVLIMRSHTVCFSLPSTVIVVSLYSLSLLLLLAGDVELNPGPGLGTFQLDLL